MKNLVLLIIILLIGILISSCHVTETTTVHYNKSLVLENLIEKSQDTSFASLLIKIVDINTKEYIPYAQVDIINGNKKTVYYSSVHGYLLIPNIKQGIYDIRITFVGFATLTIKSIELSKKDDVFLTAGLFLETEMSS